MVHGHRIALAEHGIRKGLAFANGDRRQLNAIGYVAHGIDVIDIGLAEAIDLDFARLAKLDARIFQAEPLDVRYAADREHHEIGLLLVAIRQFDEIATLVARLDILERGVEAELDPLHRADLQQAIAHRLVILAQQHLAAIDDVDVAAELVEDPGEFVGYIAPARDDDLLRQFVEMERLVRTDRVFGTLAFGHARMRAGGDQDMFGGHGLAACQRDLVRAGDLGAFLEDRDVVIFERVGIGPFDPGHIVEHIVAQGLPVELALADLPAEPLAIFQILGEMRAVDEHLLGHTAPDDAGSPDPVLFCDRDLGTVRGGHAAGAHAPRSGTDGEEVVIVFVRLAVRGHRALQSGGERV